MNRPYNRSLVLLIFYEILKSERLNFKFVSDYDIRILNFFVA